MSLLNITKCQFLLSAPETKVDHILDKFSMQHVVISTFDEWLAQESIPHYPYEKSFEEAANDPFIVIHTSGSTGLPKPITLRHGGLATADAHHVMPTSNSYHPEVILPSGERPPRVFASLPPFHVSHCCSGSIFFYHSRDTNVEILDGWHTRPTYPGTVLSSYSHLAAWWSTNQHRHG